MSAQLSFADENINETSRGATTPKITINQTNNVTQKVIAETNIQNFEEAGMTINSERDPEFDCPISPNS